MPPWARAGHSTATLCGMPLYPSDFTDAVLLPDLDSSPGMERHGPHPHPPPTRPRVLPAQERLGSAHLQVLPELLGSLLGQSDTPDSSVSLY